MAYKILLPLLLLVAGLPASLAVIDVQQLLGGKAQYSSFLKLLTDTKVADDVSRLKSASVLVVTNKAIKPLLSVPPAKQRMVLLNHVLLKYFDPIQLGEMKTPTAMLETLLYSTDKRLGVINYTKADDGQMYLRAPGAAGVAKLVKVVAARPFAVSVMEVSAPIMCPELAGPAGADAAAAGRLSKGGKGGKARPLSDESGGMAASTAAGSGSAAPSAAPTASPK